MPIWRLMLSNTRVVDLRPLQGMPLENVLLQETAVTDISPLKDAPLFELRLDGNRVYSLTPLARNSVRHLHIGLTPWTPQNLATLSTLELLSFGFDEPHLHANKVIKRMTSLQTVNEHTFDMVRRSYQAICEAMLSWRTSPIASGYPETATLQSLAHHVGNCAWLVIPFRLTRAAAASFAHYLHGQLASPNDEEMEHALREYLLAVSDPGTDTIYHLGEQLGGSSINHNRVLHKNHARREVVREESGANMKHYVVIEWRNL
jgi:hypothetical protein